EVGITDETAMISSCTPSDGYGVLWLCAPSLMSGSGITDETAMISSCTPSDGYVAVGITDETAMISSCTPSDGYGVLWLCAPSLMSGTMISSCTPSDGYGVLWLCAPSRASNTRHIHLPIVVYFALDYTSSVSLCVCLTAVSGMPAAKRLPIPHDTDDVLAGSDFLSMFMQRSMRTADRPDGPFEPHHYDHDLNSVIHPHPHLSAKYKISDIYKTAKYGYAVSEMPSEAEDYQVTTPPVSPTLESEVRTTTQFVDPTTIQDIPTTIDDVSDRLATNFTIEEQAPTVLTGDDSTRPETTTQQTATEKVEEQVISVRVSSSVVRHSHRVETSTARSTPEVVSQPRRVDENLVSTLVTQDQPTITAVQRSEFAVEEASLSDSEATNHRQSKAQSAYDREEEVEGKVQEVSRYNNRQQTRLNGELPVFEIHFHNAPPSLISNYGSKTETQTIEDE
ncbi:hypothetical protein J6590_101858, partial [Homalodisca vitripennis]